MKIVVFGASGNIGSKLAHHLLDAGKTVVAVGRSADKLQDLAGKGAHLAIGDLEDASFVAHVLADADRAFVMIPPKVTALDNLAYQALVGDNIIAALKANAITQVVNLSSL
ncbi:MAG: SDR family NAD(P)-dependent oxidoreductase, partial [Flexibacteraceae bacterium]